VSVAFADDKMPVVTRLTLLMLCFMLYVLIKFRAREDSMLYRYVSWNEFVHSMLAKGEVGNFSFSFFIINGLQLLLVLTHLQLITCNLLSRMHNCICVLCVFSALFAYIAALLPVA